MDKKISVVLVVLVFLFGFSGILKAQEQEIKYAQCLKNFDVHKLNFDDPLVRENLPLLNAYFGCQAASKNDISVCDKIVSAEDADVCREYFREYVDFIGSGVKRGITDKGMTVCMNTLHDQSKCRDFLNGLNTNDSSICDKVTGREKDECQALINGNPNTCGSTTCQNKTGFVKAVRAKDLKKCNRISDPMANNMCRGFVSPSPDVCVDNAGFVTFKANYCQAKSQE